MAILRNQSERRLTIRRSFARSSRTISRAGSVLSRRFVSTSSRATARS